MKYFKKDILKFLFPEIQIIDSIKQDGFFVKKKVSFQLKNKNNLQTGLEESKTVSDSVYKEESNFSSNINNKNQYKQYDTKDIDVKSINDKFDDIQNLFSKQWIGSSSNVDKICKAFKRPYIMGYNNIKPKNVIIITGNESHGKVTAVNIMAKNLKSNKIIKYSEISKLNLSIYKSENDDSVFLNDLYKALYSKTDIVVFENIEKLNYTGIEILLSLISKGSYTLPNRYIIQNNMLLQATTTLNTNSISELSCNGKFFVFTSVLSQDRVIDYLGNEFSKNISDIINLSNFNDIEIQRITRILIEKFINKCKQQLKLIIFPEVSFLNKINKVYNPKMGINGIESYINEEVYKPLVEYCMNYKISEEKKLNILYEYDTYKINVDNKLYSLGEYVKNYNAIAVDEIKKELSEVIGLDTVKEYVLNLENNLTVQKLREKKGLKTTDISMHMIFTGNPGTGKTTIARVVAKYLKAIGVLSSGQLREVSRSDMIGQYVGHTAKLTSKIIDSATGGVLFIDEAYSLCRGKNDIFGIEAIDTLVKGMEDNRDNLVVILAGYSNEMSEFLKNNSGLKSRFPNIINFEDYTPEEMYRIAEVTAKSKGYKIGNDCKKPMIEEFERKQIKGKNDSGNGRLVRNVIESAILEQSQRIMSDNTQDLELLLPQDFGFNNKQEFDLEKELSSIIGLESVKDFVRTQYNVILAKEKRKRAELTVDTSQSLNMIFTGNPGTGKTTMARVVAQMFHSMGLLKSGHLVETDKSGLIAEYVGQTAKKTEDIFKSALGGVLFIDEAYSITNDKSSFGQECIDTLVKLIEDYRGEILVILAGYSKEMNEFIKSNSGLESRFPLKIEFPDYSEKELYMIGKNMIDKKGFKLTDESDICFKNAVYELKKHATESSGNGRMVRNFIEEIIRNQSSRIATSDVTVSEMTIIIPDDIIPRKSDNKSYNLEEDLNNVIGLESVKKYIRSLNARLRIQEERKKQGLKVDETQTLHMIFKGNPGTGKTMMARTVANVLYNMGVISTNKLIETDRSGLVAGYVGQTALKTHEVIKSALNGVLFIDEAYSLAQGGENDFGKEAIDTLVKMMDDNRDRLVVILAGYSDDMENFLNQNVGLKSRFPNIIEFEDYSVDELLSIANNMYTNQGYILSEDAIIALKMLFEEGRKNKQFGNGRFVRNVYEKSLNNQALRLSEINTINTDDLVLIKAEDIRG